MCGFATDTDTKALRHRNESRERDSASRVGTAVTEEDIIFLRVQGIRWTDDDE